VHTIPVDNGVLERWDSRSLNGLYRLRITLSVRPPTPPTTAPVPTSTAPMPGLQPTPTPVPPITLVAPAPKVIEIPVIVDNQPPSASITFPQQGAIIKRDQMPKITFSAQVSDNHQIASTDFYLDNQLVGSSRSSPATLDWSVTVGEHTLRAVARDAAGNETTSGEVRFKVQ